MQNNSEVFLLWHVHHAENSTNNPIHFENSDDFWSDEEAGDDSKLLGVYSSRARVDQRIQEARLLPGFSEEPNFFYVQAATLDENEWPDGFVTVY